MRKCETPSHRSESGWDFGLGKYAADDYLPLSYERGAKGEPQATIMDVDHDGKMISSFEIQEPAKNEHLETAQLIRRHDSYLAVRVSVLWTDRIFDSTFWLVTEYDLPLDFLPGFGVVLRSRVNGIQMNDHYPWECPGTVHLPHGGRCD
jgi:hypothetical protein